MDDGNHIDIADDLPKCSACGLPISGKYASCGGNFVPPIAPKLYHMECIPAVTELLAGPCSPKTLLWTATERGHLLYCGRVVADMRYANARGRVSFILAALNAAEEKL